MKVAVAAVDKYEKQIEQFVTQTVVGISCLVSPCQLTDSVGWVMRVVQADNQGRWCGKKER
jgi:hypothetical protein